MTTHTVECVIYINMYMYIYSSESRVLKHFEYLPPLFPTFFLDVQSDVAAVAVYEVGYLVCFLICLIGSHN